MEIILFGPNRSDIITGSDDYDFEGGLDGGNGDGETGSFAS